MDIATWLGSEFWAAIAGAVVGGVIAFSMQTSATRRAGEQRNSDREEARKAQAHSMVFKMMRIHSNFDSFHLHLEQALGRKPHSEPWQVVQPFASLPDRIHFTSDEMGMLLSLKDPDVFNLVASFDMANNAMIDNFALLRERRFSLAAQLPAKMKGLEGTSLLSESQMQYLGPLMAELNALIQDMRSITREENGRATHALLKLVGLLNSKLSLGLQLELKPEKEHTSSSRG